MLIIYIGSDVKKLQKEMQKLFLKQKEKGGIIDLEVENINFKSTKQDLKKKLLSSLRGWGWCIKVEKLKRKTKGGKPFCFSSFVLFFACLYIKLKIKEGIQI